MAEKGNDVSGAAAQVVATASGASVERVVERTTQEVTSTIAQTGDTLRDKVIDTTADHAIDEVRTRLNKPDPELTGEAAKVDPPATE